MNKHQYWKIKGGEKGIIKESYHTLNNKTCKIIERLDNMSLLYNINRKLFIFNYLQVKLKNL